MEDKGSIVFKRALWTTAISLSWSCTYFLVSVACLSILRLSHQIPIPKGDEG